MTYVDEIAEKFDGALKEGLLTFRVTLYGPRAASVEGAKRILYYDEKCVKFAAGRRVVEIKGENLRISSCNGNEYYITGEISAAEVS